MAYFITNDDSTKGKDPNINIINGLHDIRGPKEANEVNPDTFHPPCHKLKPSFESKLDTLLKEYTSQFVKDETSIGMTPLTEMTIDKAPLILYLRNHTQSLWRIING